jgi:SSS family solute:Na+ symporter
MQTQSSIFGLTDYTVLALYLLGMLVLGLVFYKRQTSLSEYYHASSSLPWWAVGVSLLATTLSPITYLASPGWIFLKDSREIATGVLLATIFFPLTALLWAPLWNRLRVLSIYEYLERRYHPSIRTIGAVLFILTQVAWVSTALVTVGLGFEQVTGFDGRLCLVVIALLGTAYTVVGGMRAVIWTDVAQFGVFILGYVAILFALLEHFSWEPLEIYRIASTTISEKSGQPHTRMISFELDLSVEASFWAMLMIYVQATLVFGVDQLRVQRLHATRSFWDMFKSQCGNALCFWIFAILAIPAAWGLVAFYSQHPDLHAAITHPDQVLPAFAAQHLPAVFRSLIMAGVLAALMSSLDSSINSMSNVATSDFYRRYWNPAASEKKLVAVGKGLTLLFGLLLLAFSISQFDRQGDTAFEKFVKLSNVIASPLVSFFLLGVFSRRANTGGVVVGAVFGVAFSVVFNGIPGVVEPQLDWINWMAVGLLATGVNLAVGYLASSCFVPPTRESLKDLTYRRVGE